MTTKILLAFLVAFTFYQVITGFTTNHRVARETPDDASKTINEMWDSFKTGFDDMIKNIQNNDLVQNATLALQQFAQNVEAQGKDLLNKAKQ